MTVILYSEGKRDFAALPPLILSTCAADGPSAIECRPIAKVHGSPRRGHRRQRGYAFKVERTLLDAVRDGDDAVVVVVDEDRDRKRRAALDEGRERVSDVACAIGVPRPMLEAWLLGDERAFSRAFGATPEGIPARPEEQTRPEPSASSAKAVLERLIAAAEAEPSAEAYGELADQIDPTAVQASCPASFAPFAMELRERIATLLAPPA